MRQALALLLAVTLLAGAATAGQAPVKPWMEPAGPRQEFMHGLYSLTIPQGWWTSFNPNDLTLTIAESQNSPARLIVSPPNPNVAGQTAEYGGMVLGALFAEMGEGAMLGEDGGQMIGGKPSTFAAFEVKANDGSDVVGSLTAIEADPDYGVVITFMAPNDEKYTQVATIIFPAIVNSYILNPNRLKVWERPLQNAADRALDQVHEILGDDGDDAEEDSDDAEDDSDDSEDDSDDSDQNQGIDWNNQRQAR